MQEITVRQAGYVCRCGACEACGDFLFPNTFKEESLNMARRFIGIVLIVGAVVIGIRALAAQKESSSQTKSISPQVVGVWKGESICVNKEKFPACNDEQVVYHIKKSAAASDQVTIAADKIVHGKAEEMGVLDFKYDSEKGSLVCEFSSNTRKSIFEFTVKADSMEGTLKALPDSTLIRRIKLNREK
ncbi:MAG: hypothetical protein JST85_30720 [Acidobacteria bacterium]|nr:hypothetical protein [Acidobacteriota bacterium]